MTGAFLPQLCACCLSCHQKLQEEEAWNVFSIKESSVLEQCLARDGGIQTTWGLGVIFTKAPGGLHHRPLFRVRKLWLREVESFSRGPIESEN